MGASARLAGRPQARESGRPTRIGQLITCTQASAGIRHTRAMFSASSAFARRIAITFVLICLLGGAATVDARDVCDFVPTTLEVRQAGEEAFVPIGAQLNLPPRLRPTTSEVRFHLPPTTTECVLLVDRVSLHGLAIALNDEPSITFDFFRPGLRDRYAASGYSLNLPAHAEPLRVTLRITQLGVLSTRVSRIDTATLLSLERRISAIHALSLVAPLMMAALVGVFWLRLRDRALAAYVGLLVSLVLVTASLDGTLFYFPIGALFAPLKSMSHILTLSLFGLAMSVFFREFLAPLDRGGEFMFRLLAGAFTFTGISSLLGIPVYSAIIQHLTTFSFMVAVPLLLWQAWRSWRSGQRLAGYLLIGWSLPLGAILLRLAAEYGVLEWNAWLRYSPRLAFLLEALVFAYGLADRILHIRIERDRAEQARLRSERALIGYRRLVEADALTGLASRRALESELQRWDAEAIQGSCLFIDIDRFKDFNDRHGHAQGDEALRAVAAGLASLIQSDAHLARYGGEEFVGLLPKVSLNGARALAEIARNKIGTSRIGAQELSVTLSIGVAERQGDEPMAVTLARADTALYQAKAGGRNRVEADRGELP